MIRISLKEESAVWNVYTGGALLCAIHGATVENTLFEDGDAANTFRAFTPLKPMVKNERKLDLISSRSSSSSSSSSSSYYATKHLNKFKKHHNQTNGQDHASTSKSASSFANIEQQTNKTQQQQSQQQQNGIDWKITMLDGTQTVELNTA